MKTLFRLLALLPLIALCPLAEAAYDFVAIGSMSTSRQWHTATLLANGKVLVTGGQGDSGNSLTSVQLYDPASGLWSTTGSLANARCSHTATLLGNGKVLVAGGLVNNSSFLSSAELYDPATGGWSTTGSMATASAGHTASLLKNGKVLIAGGVEAWLDGGDMDYLTSAELYDSTTGLWITTGSMAIDRAGHTATLLNNGKVLVAGGADLSSAELYNAPPDLRDSDGDGLINYDEEWIYHTNPYNSDTNGNGIGDGLEAAFGGDLLSLRVGRLVQFDLTKLGISGTMKLVGTLPAGLTFNAKTGIISGKITGKAGSYPLNLQFLSGKTVLQSIALPLVIAVYPSGLAGTFQGLLEDGQGQPEGLISLKVTAPGVWTATLDFAGSSKVLSAKGSFSLDPTQEAVDLTIPFSAATTVHLHLDPNSALVSGDYPQGSIRGFRMASGGELPTQATNLSVMFDHGAQDGYSAPAGKGWASGSLAKTGAISLSGQLGDARTFTATLSLSATGQAIIWLRPYLNKSSYFGGIVSLRETGLLANPSESSLEEGLWWSRTPDSK